MKKILIGFIVSFIFIALAPLAFAETSLDAQIKMIADLTLQIQTLQNQIKDLQSKSKTIAQQQNSQVINLLSSLSQGSKGDDVKILQAILAADESIYPEGLISGFYGSLTARAVKKFQEKHGIESVGKVGPKTLKKLNEWLQENPVDLEDGDNKEATSTDKHDGKKVCAKVPPGHLIAPGWLKNHGGEKPIVPPCQKLPPGIEDREGKGRDEHGTTTPPVIDHIAPVISSIGSNTLSSTTVRVAWITNENATGKVYYGTSTPLQLGSASIVSSLNLVILHTFELNGLQASTTYYYVAESKDSAGNTATSSEKSFLTL